jgi:hypothetical protein
METLETLDWSSIDQDNLQKFLSTQTGTRLLPRLAEAAPTLLSGGDVNAILIRNGELRGYQSALRELQTLAYPPPVQNLATTDSAYPNLLDDKAWNDGQTIEPLTQETK